MRRSSSLFDEKIEAIENRFNVDVDELNICLYLKWLVIIEGSEIGAAFGLAQLEDLDNNLSIQQQNFDKQNNFFSRMKIILFYLSKQKGLLPVG